jgi:hypothetical protein
MAVALALPTAGLAAGATPNGSSPDQAIPLVGTLTGTLAPGQVAWYSYTHDPNINDAVTLKSNPALVMTPTSAGDYNTGVFFNVEWLGSITDANFPGGQIAKDLPGYFRIGQSTQASLKSGSLLPDGVQYWQQNKSTWGMPLTLEVVNDTAGTASYALTLDRSNAAVSADDNAMPAPWPTIAAASSPQVVSAAPVAQPASAIATGGLSPEQAVPVTARTVRGSLAPGEVTFYSYTHDPNFNDAITMKTSPAIAMTPTDVGDYWGGAYFNMEWQGSTTDSNFPGGQLGKDQTGFWRVGQSTQSGLESGSLLPDGTQYWQQDKSTFGMPFVVEVVNQSPSTINYALTIDHSSAAVSADDNAMPAPMP